MASGVHLDIDVSREYFIESPLPRSWECCLKASRIAVVIDRDCIGANCLQFEYRLFFRVIPR